MAKKFTFEYIDDQFSQGNCILKETEYINSSTLMRYICSCGNESIITWDGFKAGHRCKQCANKKIADNLKLDLDFHEEFKKENCILLEKNYINSDTPMRYICSCGTESKISWSNFKAGKRCKNCKNKKIGDKKRTHFSTVKDFFSNENCILEETEYINNSTPMRYICSCGNKGLITFKHFKDGQRCKECGIKKRAEARRSDGQKIKDFFALQKCELLDGYINNSTPMRYICSCGREAKVCWHAFKAGARCRECAIDRQKGEKNYRWNPDRSQIQLNFQMRRRFYSLLRTFLISTNQSKRNHTNQLLGYTLNDFQSHLESFPQWRDVQYDYHIDHIFPIKAFFEYNITDASLVCCLENLQLLTPEQNLAKAAKYNPEEFEAWLSNKNIPFESKLNGVA